MTDLVSTGDRGVLIDLDGGPDSYVVDFGPGRTFCCAPAHVRLDPVEAPRQRRRHAGS